MSFFVGGTWVDAPTGSLVIAPGGTAHDFENRTGERAGALNVSVPGDFEPHMLGIAEWFRARSAAASRTAKSGPKKPQTIDAYLATVTPDGRLALEKLRKTIRSILPDAEECIRYSMPAFRYEGHVVAGFLATRKGCSYFPFSGTTLATVADTVRAYGQTKSALHFDPTKGLPATVVRKLLRARIAELG